MSIENAVYQHFSTYPSVTSLIGTRIYPLVIPQDADMPAIAYQIIDDSPVYEMHGQAGGVCRARIQLTMQGSYSQMVALRYAVQNAVHAFTGSGDVAVQSSTVEAVRDTYSEVFERATRRVDMIVWYQDGGML